MKLADWIAREGLPVLHVAELSGVSRASVTNARNGRPLETFELAQRLVQLTGGEVTHEDLSDPTGEVRQRIAREVVPWVRQKQKPDLARDEALRARARRAVELFERAREFLGQGDELCADLDLDWAEASDRPALLVGES